MAEFEIRARKRKPDSPSTDADPTSDGVKDAGVEPELFVVPPGFYSRRDQRGRFDKRVGRLKDHGLKGGIVVKEAVDPEESLPEPKRGRPPSVVVRKNPFDDLPSDARRWMGTEVGYLEGATRMDGKPLELYFYQRRDILDPSIFQHRNKARQTGFSFAKAAKGFARCMVLDDYTRIFISMNQEEADEKIRYARELYFSVDERFRTKRLVVDNKHSLEFESIVGSGRGRARTRLISLAQRPPRGKGKRTDIVLDEFAHYQWDRKIYTAAIPVVTRGGQFEICSTPFGDMNMHYEISEKKHVYKVFSRQAVAWFFCHDLCSDPVSAIRLSRQLTTAEMVRRFGTVQLKAVFGSMDQDDFEQEYGCKFLSEAASYFPLDMIHACCVQEEGDYGDVDPDYVGERPASRVVERHPKVSFKTYPSLETFAAAVQGGEASPELLAGYDVGRKKDKAELVVLEEYGEEEGHLQAVRYLETFSNWKFPDQRAYLAKAMRLLPGMRLAIGSQGMGAQISEELYDAFGDRVKRIEESHQWNTRAIVDLHIRFQDVSMAIPFRKDLVTQIHSIRRSVTALNTVRFDVELTASEAKRHHADKFFALLYSSSLGVPASERRALLLEGMGDQSSPSIQKFEAPMRVKSPDGPRVLMPRAAGMAGDLVIDHFDMGKFVE